MDVVTWLGNRQIDLGGARVSLLSLLFALGTVVAGFLLASILASRLRGPTDAEPPRWRGALARMSGHAVRLLAVSFALEVAGVNIGNLLAAGAVLAVGIGIAMQKVAENFVSGVILMTERSIREGDVIQFQQQFARVRHIGIRATRALTLDDEEIIVPNSLLVQSMVKNLTLTDPSCRVRARVGVSYGSDLVEVEAALLAAAGELGWRDERKAPVVLLVEFASSSVDFDVSVWTREAWSLPKRQSELRKAVWRALRDAGITIAFPQIDVHFDRAPAMPAGGASTEASTEEGRAT